MPRTEFSQTVRLLALISHRHPESNDALKPHGHTHHGSLDWGALNLQPLSPGPSDPLVVAAVHMSNRLVTLALEANVRNERATDWLAEIIEDWCGTPWPRKWPWPGPGPAPDFGPEEGPRPEPWSVAAAKASGALVFASLAVRLGEGELRDALVQGAEKLADAAVNQF